MGDAGIFCDPNDSHIWNVKGISSYNGEYDEAIKAYGEPSGQIPRTSNFGITKDLLSLNRENMKPQ